MPAGAEDTGSSRRWLPGHPTPGTELLGITVGLPMPLGPQVRQSKFPSLHHRSPAEGTLPRHLSLLGETTASRDLPPVPSGMCRAGTPLLFLLFLPRSPLCCECWAPRCHVPARTGGRLLGHLLTQGRNQTGTFPAAAPGGIWAPRAAPHHRDFFCSDISVSLCHLVPTRSRGGGDGDGTCSTHALWGVPQNTHFWGFWLAAAHFFPIRKSTSRLLRGCPRMCFAVVSAVELLL